MGSRAHKSAAQSCIAFSYAALIQPTPTRRPSSCSYDQIYTKCGSSYTLPPSESINIDQLYLNVVVRCSKNKITNS